MDYTWDMDWLPESQIRQNPSFLPYSEIVINNGTHWVLPMTAEELIARMVCIHAQGQEMLKQIKADGKIRDVEESNKQISSDIIHIVEDEGAEIVLPPE